MPEADYKYNIQSAEKTLHILELLAGGSGQLTVSQIAEKLDAHVSGVTRFLRTLQTMGYVEKDPATGRYGLTDQLFLLSDRLLVRHPLTEHYLNIMYTYAHQFNMTTHISSFFGQNMVTLHKDTRLYNITLNQAFFDPKRYLYCSAPGRLLLAGLPPEALDAYFQTAVLIKYQPKTLATEPEIRAELEQTRARGYAINDEEYIAGTYTISFPLRVAGAVRGALSFVCYVQDKHTISSPIAIRDIQTRLGNMGA
ncbi:MAG: IclR family transcriptional regulator [Ruminococcaceae bacterium]|nr:IclR family transcriptional regulator [Oscillospiraceae bacterium]